MYENFVVQSLISSLRRAVLLGSFAALGFSVVWNELQMCLTVGLGYCLGILNRLVVLTFQELGTFCIKVKDLSVCNCKVVKA
jgi:hypothetical protein